MSNIAKYLPLRVTRKLQSPDLVGGILLGLGIGWVLKIAVRQLMHKLFPQALPGEPNTVLLATPRPNSSTPAIAQDLKEVVEYDYIIVGTGTAGSVLANRLSADSNVSVLAVEAGHSDVNQLMSRIPAGFTKLFRTGVDWQLTTTPQTGCNDRKLFWPRGKMIGGSSSINAMMYTKGAPEDYDEWQALGNNGWGYKDLASYLKKAETFTQPKDSERTLPDNDLAQHGRDGPWNVSYTAQGEITQIFPYGCDAIGIPRTKDINTDRGMLGATPTQTFIDQKGQRSSAAVAYLTADVVSRSNLKIASGQNVTRIIFDTDGAEPRAVAVEMAASKFAAVRYLAKARKEVILCAGSIGTPQLLKISGIGPAKELEEHSIPVIKDLPGVGENLIDHVAYHGVAFKTEKKYSLHHLQDQVKSLPHFIEWLRFGTGWMTSQGCDSFAFINTTQREDAPEELKTRDLSSSPNAPDLELMGISVCFTNHGEFIAPLTDGYGTLASVSLRPVSRGTVTLQTSSIFDNPLIDPKSLSNPHDLAVLLYGTKLCLKIAKSAPYKDYFKGWYIGPHHPLDWDTATDAQIEEQIRNKCETLYHPMGTARMGKKPTVQGGDDAGAVVSDELKVWGVKGLRVVDASVFPTSLACHPCAPVVAIAEKAADMILSDR